MAALRAICFFIFVSPALASEGFSLLCAYDKATGFSMDSAERWRVTRFEAEKKFVVRLIEDDDSIYLMVDRPYGVFELGDNSGGSSCTKPSEKNRMYCDGLTREDIRIDLNTMRFLWVYSSGYTEGDENSSTPFMAIGRCSKI